MLHEPFSGGERLPRAVRARLDTAGFRPAELPRRYDMRAVTLTADGARQFEAWLLNVLGRRDAPAGTLQAIAAVRDGLRDAR